MDNNTKPNTIDLEKIDTIENSEVGNYTDNSDNSINDSYNNIYNINYTQINYNPPLIDSLENSNNRTILKSMVNKEITIWAYAIDEYKRIPEKNIVRYTIINLHDKDNYIADHIQLDIPYEIYNEDIRHKIIKIIGNVYEYKEKQSIEAKKIIISDSNDLYISKDFIKVINNMTTEKINQAARLYSSYNLNQRYELLLKYIKELNELLPNMRNNFICDYIITQYTLNYDPDLMNEGKFNLLRNDVDSLKEITFLILSIMKRISEGMNNLNDIFNYINWILNDMQGLKEDDIYNGKIIKMKANKAFKMFCKKHRVNINNAFIFVRKRNKNFYPKVLNKNEAYADALQVLYLDNVDKSKKDHEL